MTRRSMVQIHPSLFLCVSHFMNCDTQKRLWVIEWSLLIAGFDLDHEAVTTYRADRTNFCLPDINVARPKPVSALRAFRIDTCILLKNYSSFSTRYPFCSATPGWTIHLPRRFSMMPFLTRALNLTGSLIYSASTA